MEHKCDNCEHINKKLSMLPCRLCVDEDHWAPKPVPKQWYQSEGGNEEYE